MDDLQASSAVCRARSEKSTSRSGKEREKRVGRAIQGDVGGKIEGERNTDDEAGRESVQRSSRAVGWDERGGVEGERRNLLQDGASCRANNTIR